MPIDFKSFTKSAPIDFKSFTKRTGSGPGGKILNPEFAPAGSPIDFKSLTTAQWAPGGGKENGRQDNGRKLAPVGKQQKKRPQKKLAPVGKQQSKKGCITAAGGAHLVPIVRR